MSFYQLTNGFYQQLRESGFAVTISEYHLLLEAMQKGLGIENKARFVETCQLLWAKTPEQNQIVAEQFAIYHEKVMRKINPPPPEPPISSEGTGEATINTEKDSDKRKGVLDNDPSKNESDKPKEANKKQYDTENAPFLYFYPPQEGEARGEVMDSQLYSQPTPYIKSPFILTNDFLPLSLRQMQQIWRKLRYYATNRASKQIDWTKTIGQIAQQGAFIQPIYKAQRSNQIQLIILIDHHGSMTPYQTLAEQLITSAREQGGYPDAKVYYTHNIPNSYLYENKGHSQAISIADMLSQCASKRTVFLFFSDAGAARGLFNVQRIIATKRFVEKLRKRVHAIAWLNPMPKHRWENTSAELLKHLVPMFECSETDMEAAIKTLKTLQKR